MCNGIRTKCVSNLTAVLLRPVSRAGEFIGFDISMEYFMVSGFERSVCLLHSGDAAGFAVNIRAATRLSNFAQSPYTHFPLDSTSDLGV